MYSFARNYACQFIDLLQHDPYLYHYTILHHIQLAGTLLLVWLEVNPNICPCQHSRNNRLYYNSRTQ